MRIAVVGLGMAGSTLACLLADRGHDVVVLEQAEDPRPVGAGIWLQHMGQQVLERLGLLQPLRTRSREVSRVDIRTSRGRRLVDVSYAEVPGSVPALGVHRGTLFALLLAEVRRRGIPVELGVRVTGARPAPDGVAVETETGDRGTYDLVVGGDGSRSPVRRSMGVAARDRPYAYGALWSIVEDPDGLCTDELFQSLRGTRHYLGVLPTGLEQVSVFWSERDPARTHGDLEAWRAAARPLAGPMAPLLDRVDHLLPATYRDVVVRTPYRLAHPGAAVLVGDAAHAMSPQLGTGTSLALADAWTLHHALATEPTLERALTAYAAHRAAHVRWYQWWTRLMMPVFQSGATPLAWPRDALAPAVTRATWVREQVVTTLLGDRTSPWHQWRLPEISGAAASPAP
ncbi:FAD-dependent monooxygenase [Nocardioides anomalus]|uniref:FAD-dependent monooxygenase n=1 Tax=Nocardioides anomalus TaxID=2712223 RepID=A0A6G6W8X3_9ACTN|nr:NAD(P)/FAD-dependent oxidoreductase [Nocardioides anomalus]QIG41788.1 FAD-dependent monooxygenase [Nocardioides anomalus]